MTAPRPNLRFGWVQALDKHLKQGGLTAVRHETHPIASHFESFHSIIKLVTCEEALSLMPDTPTEQPQELPRQLEKAYDEIREHGAGITSDYILALGRKPSIEANAEL